MPPIRKGDGTPVTPKGISQIRTGDGRILFDGPAIPDSVVSREADNRQTTDDRKFGLRIETTSEWPRIGAELSENVGSMTRAYIFRVSDGLLMGDADISGLDNGDTFTIDLDNSLVSDETYNFVVDAEGADYSRGFDDGPTFPYDSDDGELAITAGAIGENDGDDSANCLSQVGNVGFN